jgi:hypothetical protein
MIHVYRGAVVEAGSKALGRPRAQPTRGRPNWWVILAVSLALMALMAATSASTRGSENFGRRVQSLNSAQVTPSRHAHGAVTTSSAGAQGKGTTLPSVPTTTTVPAARLGAGASGAVSTTVPPSATTTTVAAAATAGTSAGPGGTTPSDRTTNSGTLQPPSDPSNSYGFTGHGPMQVSVTWGDSTYLTLTVTCPNASQGNGGTSAMAVSLPDAEGACRATVSEPTSENTPVTYSITIGPPS